MFGCQSLYGWQSRLPLWLCDDRTDLVLHDDVGLNSETEGRRRINVLGLFGRAFYGFSAVAMTSDRSSCTLAIGLNSLYILICNISLHAVLHLLMLQIYRTRITFI